MKDKLRVGILLNNVNQINLSAKRYEMLASGISNTYFNLWLQSLWSNPYPSRSNAIYLFKRRDRKHDIPLCACPDAERCW